MRSSIESTNVENGGSKRIYFGSILKDAVPFIGFILILVFFQLVSKGDFISSGNLKILINDVFIVTLGACGLSFLMSQGMFDLSMAATAAVCGVAISYAMEVGLWLALPATLFVGFAIGFINGWIITKLKVPDIVGTLAMSYTLTGVAELFLGQRSGSKPVNPVILQFDSIELKLAVLFVLGLIGFIVYNYTAFGIRARAIGSRIEAARLSGVKVGSVTRIAYIITGMMAGLVAFFSVARSATSSIETGFNLHFNALLALMIGGMSLSGGASSRYKAAIIGGISIGMITNGLSLWGLSALVQQFIRGIIFLVIIALTFNRSRMENIK